MKSVLVHVLSRDILSRIWYSYANRNPPSLSILVLLAFFVWNLEFDHHHFLMKCLHVQDFGRTPSYLEKMKVEAAEEARRWQEEQEAELRRKEAMKLSEEERLEILQV